MKRTLLTLTLLAAALNGCKTPKQSPARVGDIPPGSFQRNWTVSTGVRNITSAYLETNTLFIYGQNNSIAAFDLNGVPTFRTAVGEKGEIVGPPMVDDRRVIFPLSSTLELLTPQGYNIKTIRLSQPPRSPGVLVDETVYMGTDSETGGRVAAVALDRDNGIYRWTLLTGLVRTKPALYNNALYTATEDGRVIGLNLDRTLLWPIGPEMKDGLFHTDGKITGAIKVDESGVYVPSTDTKLYCLDPINGRLKWEYFAGEPIVESPVATADMIYIHVRGQGMVALPKKVGERINKPSWMYATGKQVLGDDATYCYMLDASGRIVAIEKSTGNLRFSTERTDFFMGVTHLDPKDPTLYVLTRSNDLVAIMPVLKSGVVGELAFNDARGAW